MRAKLDRFTQFADSLLPHETQYLLFIEVFEDEQKRAILERVDYNCRNIEQFTPYDTTLDKRKYTNLKNWIIDRLKSIDVDEQFEWMSHLERQITVDAITAGEEKRLLKAIRTYEHPHFFFTKFFQLVRDYRHFLLIRMRYEDHTLVSRFLDRYRAAYEESKRINEQIHEASLDIIKQYSGNSAESIQWEAWLTEVFYNENLDGLNRYLALVRIIFIDLNYGKFEKLKEKFDYMDELFKQGKYYSKRLLSNYYSNRLLLHTKFQELDRAAYYGYLSIRKKTHDYLLYVNNLCSVLLRRQKNEEALKLMQKAAPEMRRSANFHNKIGFVAFHVKSLNANGLYKNAENHAKSFLPAYRKEVFQYRWHIFFTTYLETLLFQHKYVETLKVIRKNQLLDRDKKYQKRVGYLPSIPWYHAIAAYREGELSWEALAEKISKDIRELTKYPGRQLLLKDLLGLLKVFLGNHYAVLQARLEQSGWQLPM